MGWRLRWLMFVCRAHLWLLERLIARTCQVQDRLIAVRYATDLDVELKGLLERE